MTPKGTKLFTESLHLAADDSLAPVSIVRSWSEQLDRGGSDDHNDSAIADGWSAGLTIAVY